MSDAEIGKYYDRIEIQRKAVVRAFARVRGMAGDDPSVAGLLSAMREVEHDAGNTGD